jgi:hypothetical protein
MRNTPFTIAEESLRMSDAMRGQPGMDRTSAPMGPNMFDGGPASKVQANTQPYNNARMTEQSIGQNTMSAVPQAGAEAIQQTRKGQLVQNNAEYKAQQMLDQRKEEISYVLGSPAIAAMGNMSPPEIAGHRANVATMKAMTMGVNPDLVQNKLSQNMYG